jgi:hypothetical protein
MASGYIVQYGVAADFMGLYNTLTDLQLSLIDDYQGKSRFFVLHWVASGGSLPRPCVELTQ